MARSVDIRENVAEFIEITTGFSRHKGLKVFLERCHSVDGAVSRKLSFKQYQELLEVLILDANLSVVETQRDELMQLSLSEWSCKLSQAVSARVFVDGTPSQVYLRTLENLYGKSFVAAQASMNMCQKVFHEA